VDLRPKYLSRAADAMIHHLALDQTHLQCQRHLSPKPECHLRVDAVHHGPNHIDLGPFGEQMKLHLLAFEVPHEQPLFQPLIKIQRSKYLSQTSSRDWWQYCHFVRVTNGSGSIGFFTVQPDSTSAQNFCKISAKLKHRSLQHFIDCASCNISTGSASSLSR
jgi:hypothetical protein